MVIETFLVQNNARDQWFESGGGGREMNELEVHSVKVLHKQNDMYSTT
jgi:hypothetical protein